MISFLPVIRFGQRLRTANDNSPTRVELVETRCGGFRKQPELLEVWARPVVESHGRVAGTREARATRKCGWDRSSRQSERSCRRVPQSANRPSHGSGFVPGRNGPAQPLLPGTNSLDARPTVLRGRPILSSFQTNRESRGCRVGDPRHRPLGSLETRETRWRERRRRPCFSTAAAYVLIITGRQRAPARQNCPTQDEPEGGRVSNTR